MLQALNFSLKSTLVGHFFMSSSLIRTDSRIESGHFYLNRASNQQNRFRIEIETIIYKRVQVWIQYGPVLQLSRLRPY